MKYEGQKINGREVTVYEFSVGKEELEIIVKLIQRAYENTPDTTDTHIYRSRLRTLTKQFGGMYTEVIKKKQLPTVKTHRIYKSIKKNIE